MIQHDIADDKDPGSFRGGQKLADARAGKQD